jgi:1,4-alpha-glucan branching enzyme
MDQQAFPVINSRKKKIKFSIQNTCASHISLVGSFNHWSHDELQLKPGKDGLWRIEIPMLPKGKYYYKFIIDDRMWVEDIDNPYREPDGVNGWNSVLTVQ